MQATDIKVLPPNLCKLGSELQAGHISLGQFGERLCKNKHEALVQLSELPIVVVDYDLQEDLQTLDSLFKSL